MEYQAHTTPCSEALHQGLLGFFDCGILGHDEALIDMYTGVKRYFCLK
jgi:hypothetical protein